MYIFNGRQYKGSSLSSWKISEAEYLLCMQHVFEFVDRTIIPFPNVFYFIYFLFIFYFYLFLAALGLCCCTRAFSSCGERGLLFVVVRGLLIAVASLVVEHGL